MVGILRNCCQIVLDGCGLSSSGKESEKLEVIYLLPLNIYMK